MTRMADLCALSAVEAARLIATRKLSPVELVDAVLDRADRVDPLLRILALPMAEAAQRAAREAEAAQMSGATLGPLHGVPVTIKDNVAIGGVPMRTTSGSFRGASLWSNCAHTRVSPAVP